MARSSTLHHEQSRLPHFPTAFFGRESELVELREAIEAASVVTLCGFGGVGKTRLALQFVESAIDHAVVDVAFVNANTTQTADELAWDIARVLGYVNASDDPISRLIASSSVRAPLIIIDSCEHRLPVVRELVRAVSDGTGRARFICTSREPLGIAAERAIRIAPFAVPGPNERLHPDRAREVPAVALFVDRATAEHPSFRIADLESMDVVLRICRRLDGLALAIELAAQWSRTMGLKALEERLGARFRLLAQRRSSMEPHQQSLQSLVDWSYDRLDAPSQTLFRRLGVFASTFSLEAAIAINRDNVPNEWTTIDMVATLVDKSLVSSEVTPGGPHFRLLDTLRLYALDRLDEHDGRKAIMRLREDWCISAAARTDFGPPETTIFRLLPNLEDFRAALHAAVGTPSRLNDAVTLIAKLHKLWILSGAAEDVATHADALLSEFGDRLPTSRRALLLFAIFQLRLSLGEHRRLVPIAARAWAAADGLSDPAMKALLLSTIAEMQLLNGEKVGVFESAVESLRLAQLSGNGYVERYALATIAHYHWHTNDLTRAMDVMREAIDIARRLGALQDSYNGGSVIMEIILDAGDAPGALLLLEGLRPDERSVHLRSRLSGLRAAALLATGNLAEARAAACEAVELSRRFPRHLLLAMHVFIASTLDSEPIAEGLLLGYVRRAFAARVGERRSRCEHRTYMAALNRLSERLGRGVLCDAMTRGESLSDRGAVELVMTTAANRPKERDAQRPHEAPAKPPIPDLMPITAREWTIARLVASGMSNAAIADELGLSRRTVESHVATILRKCEIPNRSALASRVASLIAA